MLDLSFLENPYYEIEGFESKVSVLEELIDNLRSRTIESNEGHPTTLEIKLKSGMAFKETIFVDVIGHKKLNCRVDPESVSLTGVISTGFINPLIEILNRKGSYQFSIGYESGGVIVMGHVEDMLVVIFTEVCGCPSKVSYKDVVGQPKEINLNEESDTENHS